MGAKIEPRPLTASAWNIKQRPPTLLRRRCPKLISFGSLRITDPPHPCARVRGLRKNSTHPPYPFLRCTLRPPYGLGFWPKPEPLHPKPAATLRLLTHVYINKQRARARERERERERETQLSVNLLSPYIATLNTPPHTPLIFRNLESSSSSTPTFQTRAIELKCPLRSLCVSFLISATPPPFVLPPPPPPPFSSLSPTPPSSAHPQHLV